MFLLGKKCGKDKLTLTTTYVERLKTQGHVHCCVNNTYIALHSFKGFCFFAIQFHLFAFLFDSFLPELYDFCNQSSASNVLLLLQLIVHRVTLSLIGQYASSGL